MVEDQLLVAMEIRNALASFGCETVGPVSRLKDALERIRTEPVDAVLLDINLAGEQSYPAADELERRGIPYIRITGYAEFSILERYRQRPRLAKPFDVRRLREMLEEILTPRL